MKNIMVLMHDDVGQESRFQAALDLTRALDGHLTCLDVTMSPMEIADYASLGGASFVLCEEEPREARNRERMEQRLSAEDVAYDWIQATGYISRTVCEHAGTADLIVLSRAISQVLPDMQEIAGEVLLKSGRPIVAVPADCKRFDIFGHAIVAWDGSSPAEAALRAAVPLLTLASAVTLVECTDGSTRAPAEEAAAWLSRHGIKSVVERVPAGFERPSSILLERIDVLGASWLVMGGFGHNRLVEAVLGGVTRRMLKESPVPLVLAHQT